MISKKERGPDASVRMNKALTALKQQIGDFRKSSYDNFVSTLLESQRTTKVNLYLGMIIGQ